VVLKTHATYARCNQRIRRRNWTQSNCPSCNRGSFPRPLPLFASTSFQIDAALRDWLDGFDNGKRNEFSRANYQALYTAHLDKLYLFAEKAPAHVRAWRQELFDQAR